MTTRDSKSFMPTLERLEARELLAGNVTVALTAGDLVITGDSSSNHVKITQIDTDSFRVTSFSRGGSATNINGGTTPRTFHGVYDDIRVYLQAGNDRIDVEGTASNYLRVPDDLTIYTHAGNDYLNINYVRANDMLLDTGSGQDTTHANHFQTYDDMTVQDNHYNTGDYDVVYIENFKIGSLDYYGTLTLDLNNGDDRIYLDSGVVDYFYASLYDGDDYLSIKNTQLNESSYLNGGLGTDGLNLYSNGQGFTNSCFNNFTRLP